MTKPHVLVAVMAAAMVDEGLDLSTSLSRARFMVAGCLDATEAIPCGAHESAPLWPDDPEAPMVPVPMEASRWTP